MTSGTRLMLAAAPLLLAGCSLLFPYMDPYFDPYGGYPFGSDPYLPEPTLLATYERGSATLTIDQDGQTQTVTLDSVASNSQLDSLIGASVSWRNDEGWIVLLNAYDYSEFGLAPFGGGASGDVTLQRIIENEFWMAGGYMSFANRCIVDISELSETRIAGEASCRSLQWADGTAGFGVTQPAVIEGQEPFDAEITFEARP